MKDVDWIMNDHERMAGQIKVPKGQSSRIIG